MNKKDSQFTTSVNPIENLVIKIKVSMKPVKRLTKALRKVGKITNKYGAHLCVEIDGEEIKI